MEGYSLSLRLKGVIIQIKMWPDLSIISYKDHLLVCSRLADWYWQGIQCIIKIALDRLQSERYKLNLHFCRAAQILTRDNSYIAGVYEIKPVYRLQYDTE